LLLIINYGDGIVICEAAAQHFSRVAKRSRQGPLVLPIAADATEQSSRPAAPNGGHLSFGFFHSKEKLPPLTFLRRGNISVSTQNRVKIHMYSQTGKFEIKTYMAETFGCL
jgi:hypothetical protein